MIYAILRRYAGGPKDLVRLEKIEDFKGYCIKNVLINKDDQMHYEYDKTLEVWTYTVGKSIFACEETPLQLNEYDKLFEVEDDDSAKLYYEVLDQ